MYLKLSIRNARRSVCDYLLYIATMIILLSIMEVSNYIAVMGNMQAGFQTASLPILITLIMVILVVYINNFILRQRAKEFANYLLLGMEKSRLSWMFILEFLFIGIGCLAISGIIGSVIFAFFYKMNLNLFGVSFLQTFFYFCIVEALSSFCIKRNMDKLQIRELMDEKKRNENSGCKHQYRNWGIIFGITFICLMGLLCGIAFLPEDLGYRIISIISVPMLISIFAFYKWLFQYFAAKRQEQPNYLYQKNRLYMIAQITSGLKTNAIMNSIFSVCLIFSAMAYIFGMFMLQPDLTIFHAEEQNWMGFLQICLCIIFLVIYFSIISLQQIIELKREAKSIQILHYIGKSNRQVKALVRMQITIQLLVPTIMCFLLLLVGIPLLNLKLNAVLPAAMSNILIKFAGWYVISFFALYLCYFFIVCTIGRRYVELSISK